MERWRLTGKEGRREEGEGGREGGEEEAGADANGGMGERWRMEERRKTWFSPPSLGWCPAPEMLPLQSRELPGRLAAPPRAHSEAQQQESGCPLRGLGSLGQMGARQTALLPGKCREGRSRQ